MATISDVARASGVSPTTVSFVLNNGPRPVSAETRQRVLEAMKRLNYRPSGVARGLARQRMYSLGVLFSGHDPRIVHNPYAVALLDGIVAAATTRGYDVTLITRHWSHGDPAVVCDGRSDGILILSPLMGADAALGEVSAHNTPLVQIGAASVLPQTTSFDVDNVAGARLAARHLLDLGHRRFALLLGPSEYEHVTERRRAFLAELASAGIETPPDAHLLSTKQTADDARMIETLLRQDNRPTAILATSDQLALMAQRTARSLGLSLPQQLSITGFDDAPGSGAELSGLTTIRQPLFEMGTEATRCLIDRIEGSNRTETSVEGDTATASRLFAPELVVRESTGPPPR